MKMHTPGSGFKFQPCDSATFASEAHSHDWLVPQVLVGGQPGLIGGPKKACKTSVALDLALSLGSGMPFLGKFVVPQQVRVAILSGESGVATLQDTARRVCDAKGVDLAACDVLWQTDLPCLSEPVDRERLQEGLAAAEVKVVMIDPLYLCLLGGQEKASATNVFEIGPLLLKAAKACLDAGATPLLLHHATKGAAKKTDAEPLDLEDLAFAGVGEFARQWLLLNRRQPYQPGSGFHALNLAIGGSAGHSALWSLDINEGKASTPRGWQVRVYPGGELPPTPRPTSSMGVRREVKVVSTKEFDPLGT